MAVSQLNVSGAAITTTTKFGSAGWWVEFVNAGVIDYVATTTAAAGDDDGLFWDRSTTLTTAGATTLAKRSMAGGLHKTGAIGVADYKRGTKWVKLSGKVASKTYSILKLYYRSQNEGRNSIPT